MKLRFFLYPVLAISLAFNLAVVFMRCMPQPTPPRGSDVFRDHLIHDLDGPDAAIVRAVFERHNTEFMARRHDTDAAIENVRKVLAAEPFDPNALEAAMDKARAARAASQEVMQATIVDAAKQVSPEGRKMLVPPPPPNPDHRPEMDHDGGAHPPSPPPPP